MSMESSKLTDKPADATSRGSGGSSKVHDRHLSHPTGVAKKTSIPALYMMEVAMPLSAKNRLTLLVVHHATFVSML